MPTSGRRQSLRRSTSRWANPFLPRQTGIFRTLEPVFQGLAPGHAELTVFAVLELRISVEPLPAAAAVGVGAAVEAGVIVEAVDSW